MHTTELARERPLRSRAFAALTAGALAVTGLGLSSTDVGAQTAGATSSEAAGSWLADQFVDGERFEFVIGEDVYPDHGGTVDATIALAAAGVADGIGAAATDWLETAEQTNAYAGDGTTSNQSGGLAKLALLAQTRGLDARDWGEGGVDLIQRLLDMEDTGGRFTDTPDWGNDFKTFSHAFAIVALSRQGDASPSDATLDLLLTSQCADGGFDGDLDEDPGDCSSGIDSTAVALMALVAAERAHDDDEIADAVANLVSAQAADGSLGNANSTGLAVYALRLAGDVGDAAAAADAGAAYLLTLQQDCDAPEADRGAIAADDSGFDAGTAVRATAQGLYGITGLGYVDASAAGATTDQPRFDCTQPEESTTTSTTTTSTTSTTVATGGVSPAATPVRATPTFTG